MSGSFMDNLESENEESFQKILVSLLSPKNIKPKTDIEQAIPLAQLHIYARVLKAEGIKDLSADILEFLQEYYVLSVSKQRLGRKEIIQALTEGLKEERKLREKLTSSVEV